MTIHDEDFGRRGFATRAIHAGQEPDPATGAIIPPIYQTSTYVQSAIGVHQGYDYSRAGNPTRSALERNVASLEGARHGAAFASGMSAIDAVMRLLKSGDHVVAGNNLYGGSPRLFRQVLQKFGLEFSFVDTSNVAEAEKAMRPNTRLLFIETPTNPVMVVSDIAALAQIAKRAGVLLIVDNTFLSPYFQQPLALGADVVVHSSTKYLGGHSDIIGGFVATSDAGVAEHLAFIQKAVGAVPSPFDAWLVLRGTKTLAVRMAQHNANGLTLAEFLAAHPRVEKVYYPGLPTHPQHALAKRQMRGFGGMIAFDTGSLEAARIVLERVRLMALAESLGGVETLISHPASMTHASVPAEHRAAIGLTDGLVRISAGIEDVEDLRNDLAQALAAI
jgi:cystathionine gamma-lyase/cystathionine beta-lyase/cystathionine gamma-lyase/homocysteine desulfhydrase